MVGIGAMVVPPDDPAAVARACVALLTDERLRREVSNSARQRSRTLFSLRTMLDGYQRIYAQVTADPAAPPPAAQLVGAATS
jgi:glycosyltransferase involved in cell wall biosynthesis